MHKKEKTRKSKFLSLVLRHTPELINISLEENGWIDIDVLLQACLNKCPITIEELNESSTILDLLNKKINLLLDDPNHRKNIEHLNLLNAKKEKILKLNQDISFEFQRKFQFRFSQNELQKIILDRFDRLDYKDTNSIISYSADLFFENSYGISPELETSYIYQHRRYQEYFFTQKLKNEYEKNPSIIRELKILSSISVKLNCANRGKYM